MKFNLPPSWGKIAALIAAGLLTAGALLASMSRGGDATAFRQPELTVVPSTRGARHTSSR